MRLGVKSSNLLGLLSLPESGHLRIFNRIRYNYNCQVRRNSSCRVFESFRQPDPIPDDLYAKTGFDNDLDWVIVSQENTGSHPHNDPDLAGAWNYLLNGYKWWVIFPNGLDAKYINCDDDCSPEPNDHSETYRWFHHVLPQLREVPVRLPQTDNLYFSPTLTNPSTAGVRQQAPGVRAGPR